MQDPIARGKIFLTPGCEDFAMKLSSYEDAQHDQRACWRKAGMPID